jgi:hypothetical protein
MESVEEQGGDLTAREGLTAMSGRTRRKQNSQVSARPAQRLFCIFRTVSVL